MINIISLLSYYYYYYPISIIPVKPVPNPGAGDAARPAAAVPELSCANSRRADPEAKLDFAFTFMFVVFVTIPTDYCPMQPFGEREGGRAMVSAAPWLPRRSAPITIMLVILIIVRIRIRIRIRILILSLLFSFSSSSSSSSS